MLATRCKLQEMSKELSTPYEHWILEGVPTELLKPVLKAGYEIRFAAGEMPFLEGEASDGLYLILKGTLELTAKGEDGEGVIAEAGPNDVIGDMGVLDGTHRSATARATSMCLAYFLPEEEFLDLLEGSALVCMRLLVLLSHRLRSADKVLASASNEAVEAPQRQSA